MDTNLLKYFVTVADEKSISKAARKLNSAQSNTTAKIQQLEKNLNCKLFHRVPIGVVLTKQGEKLYIHASEILKKIEIATLDMKNSLVEEKLLIASTEGNAVTKIGDFLVKIHKDFPNIKLELITNTTQEVKNLILNYKVDLGFISGIPNENEFEILNMIDETLVIVEPKDKEVPEVFIGFKKGCAYSHFAQEYFYQLNQKEYKKLEFASYETILACVEAGMGKSILPLSIIKKLKYEDKINIIFLPKKISSMPTCLICRKDNIPKIGEYLKNM